jgi:elongation factor Tu
MDEVERKRLMALPFRMVILGVINIIGRGIVVTGRVETGILEKEDAIFISGGAVPVPSIVTAIEMLSSQEIAHAGDSAALWLRSVEMNYIKRGMIITKQGE